MSTQDGGPAFPSTQHWINDSDMVACAPNGTIVPAGGATELHTSGISLRDYFAAKVAPVILQIIAQGHHDPADGLTSMETAAKIAYETADAMLAARSKP